MQIYVVGGAVRDILMGNIPKDIDYCVVGATHEDMIEAGYKHIEASSFPVYHDIDGNEYALARTEKKNGVGYHGFDFDANPEVTLEEDLFRRDLTINAMAINIFDWMEFSLTKSLEFLIDPFEGYADIQTKTLRHVSDHFRDDPVRVLRIARFSARYGFNICEDTFDMMCIMVANKELEHLTKERIWLEILKTMQQSKDIGMFVNTLGEIAALKYLVSNNIYRYLIFNCESFKFTDTTEFSDEALFMLFFIQNNIKDIKQLQQDWCIPNSFIEFYEISTFVFELIYENIDSVYVIHCIRSLNILNRINTWLEVINTIMVGLGHENILNDNQVEQFKTLPIELNKISILSLAKEEQNTLEGKEVGDKIWDNRRIKVNEFLNTIKIDI